MLGLQGHNSMVSSLRVFKGNSKEFKSGDLFQKNEEINYLCSGGSIGDNSIKIWNIKNGELMQTLNGHDDSVTVILSLKDMHTIVSGSEDGKIIFWNGYSGIAMTKIEKNFASIHCMSMTRDGRLIVGSSDRTISIYKISYVESAHYGRKVFAEVNLDAIIEDSCQVYSLNASMLEDNLIISGGSDAKIKVWNLQEKKVVQEMVGHKSPIGEMVMIENPFDIDKQKMFSVVSVGTGEDVMRVSSSLSPLNSGIYLSEKVSCEFGANSGPLMQVIKDNVDNSVKILVISQDESSAHFLMLKLV